jgi:hypothetical protein
MPPKKKDKGGRRKTQSGSRKTTAAGATPHESDANANEEGKMEEEDEGYEGKEADEGTSFNNNDK